ncbi:acyltransferase family protein [Pseudonocardia sp. GCM10023141]|uniref:acyltransferase family protein n=1 Tax=Pseudonocardia sp. GCM10023141 TaxID=3252653 RepID=UPI0036077CEF
MLAAPPGRAGRHSRHAQPVPATASASRLRSLDGLRGIAAVVVLVHHSFLTRPALAEPYRAPGSGAIGTADWWLTFTPAHLIWAGTEAVFVFFVLSGLVLGLSAKPGWRPLWSYYPSRVLRLFLPVWAAVAFAVVLALAVPPVWGAADSWWMAANTQLPSVAGVLRDLGLLVAPGATNHVLWSLQWEMVFSLALPLFVLAARLRWLSWAAKVALVVAAIAVASEVGSIALSSLALFALGTLMATGRERLEGWAARIEAQPRSAALWAVVMAVAAVLITSYWLLYAPGLPVSAHAVAATRALQAVGACLAVGVAWHCPGARRLLLTRPVQWLGVRSFSLYLLHLPVVTTVALLLGGAPPLPVTLMIAVPVALGLTVAFHRYVERPSHRLARRIGAAAAALAPRLESAPATGVALHRHRGQAMRSDFAAG